MGFFEALRRVLAGDERDTSVSEGVAKAWGLETPPIDAADEASAYDRSQWQKKMKRLLDELPASKTGWDELMAEARALGFDPGWVKAAQVEEFKLMVRRAVSDRRFTESEHLKLDVARGLIGLPEPEAEALLHAIVAEAEQFFGKPVEEA